MTRLNLKTMNQNLRQMEYAVRGLVPMTAEKMAVEMREDPSRYSFSEILPLNIGNPQAVSQKPLTFYRQVSALVDCPSLISDAQSAPLFDSYAIERAKECLAYSKSGLGAYSHSQGVPEFRQHVADFIERRDGYAADSNNIFLTNGASSGIQMLLTTLLSDSNSGVMIPIPQYPIYSALTKLLNGQFVGYYLDEDNGWKLNVEELQRSILDAKSKGIEVKCIVVINPGNPTSSVLSKDDIHNLLLFCREQNLVLIADEVYQENIYTQDRPFVSCKKVLKELGMDDVELASFHSTSKGFIGECGKRGGYMEMVNFDPDIQAQIVKLASSGLCSNLVGQLVTSLMVSPPPENTDAGKRFVGERNEIMTSLKKKAEMMHSKLNAIEGVECQPIQGSMYSFPKLHLPDRFVKEAENENRHPDLHYALSLLRHTGICAVPGSGFNQRDGTSHIRMTILPTEEKLEMALDAFRKHHESL